MTCASVETARKSLIEAGLASADSFRGCTEEEVALIESRFRIHLPKSYRDFLAVMGHEAGEFLVGTDYRYPYLLEFRRDAEELLREGGLKFTLSPTHFVYLFHQGYTFLFFDSSSVLDDPPVFTFTEG